MYLTFEVAHSLDCAAATLLCLGCTMDATLTGSGIICNEDICELEEPPLVAIEACEVSCCYEGCGGWGGLMCSVEILRGSVLIVLGC